MYLHIMYVSKWKIYLVGGSRMVEEGEQVSWRGDLGEEDDGEKRGICMGSVYYSIL